MICWLWSGAVIDCWDRWLTSTVCYCAIVLFVCCDSTGNYCNVCLKFRALNLGSSSFLHSFGKWPPTLNVRVSGCFGLLPSEKAPPPVEMNFSQLFIQPMYLQLILFLLSNASLLPRPLFLVNPATVEVHRLQNRWQGPGLPLWGHQEHQPPGLVKSVRLRPRRGQWPPAADGQKELGEARGSGTGKGWALFLTSCACARKERFPGGRGSIQEVANHKTVRRSVARRAPPWRSRQCGRIRRVWSGGKRRL